MRVVLVLIFCAQVAVVEATTIVAFRQPGRIILASDSLIRSSDGSVTRGCKVRRAGKFFFVLGGQISFGDGGPDTFTIVTRAIAKAGTIQEALDALLSKEGPGLHDKFKALVSREPTAKPFLSVVIGGLEHGRLMVGLFLIDLKQRESFELNVRRLTTLPNDEPLYFSASLDWDARANRLMKEPRPMWLQRGDAAAARRLIELQIADTPNKVGPPIDVLEITAAGARWVARDAGSLCQQ